MTITSSRTHVQATIEETLSSACRRSRASLVTNTLRIFLHKCFFPSVCVWIKQDANAYTPDHIMIDNSNQGGAGNKEAFTRSNSDESEGAQSRSEHLKGGSWLAVARRGEEPLIRTPCPSLPVDAQGNRLPIETPGPLGSRKLIDQKTLQPTIRMQQNSFCS
ncbi:hypothetical protein BDN72DRAFT_686603 [Pluteus cervinus]|uniref:Uncharacterized protein n=1 Tax=Pluteus cervinus TaxID=181527 RepID=A0ACD3ARG5_9AGAR|nr:hypothetical protein BDN72DRAFT_686603 [Pluteus cervinus]